MEMFALDDEVNRLEVTLPSMDGIAHLTAQITLAWWLRQRDTRRAVALAQAAQKALLLVGIAPTQRAIFGARLDLVLGEAKWLFGDLDAAQLFADSALRQFGGCDDNIGCSDAHSLLAWVAHSQGDNRLHDKQLGLAVRDARRHDDGLRVDLAEASLATSAVFRDVRAALTRWELRFELDRPGQHTSAIACISDFFGLAAHRSSDFGHAAQHWMRTYSMALETGQVRRAIIAAVNTGLAFGGLNDKYCALEWMECGLELARKTGWPASISGCLAATAETLRLAGKFDAAKTMLTEAIGMLSPTNASRSYALTLQHVGDLALDQADYDIALETFIRLQNWADTFDQADCKTTARRGQAHALSKLCRPQEAQQAAQQALDLATTQEDIYNQIAALRVLGDIHATHALEPPDGMAACSSTLHYLELAQELSDAREGYQDCGNLLDALGQEYARLGQFESAYYAGLLAKAATAKAHSQDAVNQVISMRVKQQTERNQADGEHHRQLAAAEAQRAEVLQQTSSTLARLSSIGQEITAHLDMAAVFAVLNQHVHGLLDVAFFAVYLADRDGLILERIFCIEAGQMLPISRVTVSNTKSKAARCGRERRELVIEHIPAAVKEPQPSGKLPVMSALYVPMTIGERLSGVMAIQSPHPKAYGERERLIFRTLCAYAAIAFDNSATYRELKLTLHALSETRAKLSRAAEVERRLVEERMAAEQMARQKAEEATKLKSEFLANMSHEIRTPMNAIIGMAHLALRTNLNHRQQDYVTKIHRAGLSLLSLINDILDFSKIEAGKLETEAVPFFLDELLNNVASVTSQRAAEKQLEYLFHVPSSIPRHLVGDPLRLGQVLINLVNNAIKFTDQGEIELSCALQQEATDGMATLHFAVRDTGIGMTLAQAAKLFQPFSQADGSTTRKYGGTGLGLSISQHLVEMMGGKITVNTEAGSGSVFCFDLALALADADDIVVATIPPILSGARVLVVDDSPIALEILAEALQSLSMRVQTAAGGLAALAEIAQANAEHDPYLLVFADWQMPEMDGIELTRRIEGDLTLTEQPRIILVTAFGKEDLQDEAGKLNLSGFLFKPISQSLLLNLLVTMFTPQSKAVQARGTPQHNFRGTSILLAEDNDINQQIAVELLGVVGVRVDIANTGQEAVDKLLAAGPEGYNMVLMDLEMPEMDGHEATIAIRSDARFCKLPIIAMTAHALNDVREQCIGEGMQDYLTKPIHPDHLYKTLARWLAPLPAGLAVATVPPAQTVLSPGESAALPVGGVTQSGAQALPKLPGIDSAMGMAHVAGNQVLFFHLLDRFRNSQRGAISDVREQCNSGERSGAARRVHTLRGVAGNVGAQELAHHASLLEASLEGDGPADLTSGLLAQQLQALDAALCTVLTGLDQHFASHAKPGEDAPSRAGLMSSEATRQALTQLAALLDDGDPEALEFFDSLRLNLSMLFDQVTMARLSVHLGLFEFDEARNLLLACK
jgi:signal transduction histidine kinase/DNA-binding response OmpR family regulator/HPt (histidine-containing phosphotransfer) domain-containing protein/tetratricopeptide (TPR) repeat protein